MKIGIIGSRGIPNHHGGFEQFAEYFAVFLVGKGVDVTVYNSSLHPYNSTDYKGVKIISCLDPEDKLGTAGQFIYDLNCIIDTRKRDFDIILQLGYTSNSIWFKLLPKKSIIVTNMDGLEWKRSKYNIITKKFLKYAEKLAAKKSDYLISDSKGIRDYLLKTYNKESEFIAYGANIFKNPDAGILNDFGLKPNTYNLILARIEPENNIDVILKGVEKYSLQTIVVGDITKTKLGKKLYEIYADHDNIIFLGPIYNTRLLNNLRYFSRLYFHGHSVGGTNPSLLEAMSCSCKIIAHDNPFNRSVLQDNALFFKTSDDIKKNINNHANLNWERFVQNNLDRIRSEYNWYFINKSYLKYFKSIL